MQGRLAEVERVAAHVEALAHGAPQRADEEIGRAAAEVEQKVAGAEGPARAGETRHAELLAAASAAGPISSASGPSRSRL